MPAKPERLIANAVPLCVLTLLALVAPLVVVVGCATDGELPAVERLDRGLEVSIVDPCSMGPRRWRSAMNANEMLSAATIPAGASNIKVELDAAIDVDLMLVDAADGRVIIGDNGLLHQAGPGRAAWNGVIYSYSGYNGDQTPAGLGRERITGHGVSLSDVEVRVFANAPGMATAVLSWMPPNTCNEAGSETVSLRIAEGARKVIAELPAGRTNVRIDLQADTDFDLHLFEGTEPIVGWDDDGNLGVLSAPGPQLLPYEGMNISWTGFQGMSGDPGREVIEIDGVLPAPLRLEVFAYREGRGTVTYRWGVGAGVLCGSLNLPVCLGGLTCKDGNFGHIAVDLPGACHSWNWCESNYSAERDCGSLGSPAAPGRWTCNDFQCAWRREERPRPHGHLERL
jgi:hypothetical protein